MIRIMPFIVRVYALLLRLYPREFRDEFGNEMLEVFANALAEANQRSRREVTSLLLREFWGILAAITYECWWQLICRRESPMTNLIRSRASRETDPSSWFDTLLGIIPFALFGPIRVLLAYPYPYPAWRLSEWLMTIQLIALFSLLLLGLIAGWAKGWQRWAFPYLGPWIFIAGNALGVGFSQLVLPRGKEWSFGEQILLAIASVALVVASVIFLARLIPFFKLLYRRVREDWTLLSFGLLVGAAIIFGMIEHEEDPYLTLPVILPGVLVFLCAFAYLRLTDRAWRVAALLLGVILPTVVRVVSAKTFYLFFGTVLIAVVMLPLLLEFLPHPKQAVSNA